MEDTYKDIKIKHFKLLSGDEILGHVAGVSKERNMIYIERPTLVFVSGHEFNLEDYMPLSNENLVAFSIHHIVAESTVDDSVKEHYIKYCLGVDNADASEPDMDDIDNIVYPDKKIYH